MDNRKIDTADMDADFVAMIKDAMASGAEVDFTYAGCKFAIVEFLTAKDGKEHMVVRPVREAVSG